MNRTSALPKRLQPMLATLTDAPFGRIQALVPSLLEGLEWGNAVVSLVSLDIDATEVAAVAVSEVAA